MRKTAEFWNLKFSKSWNLRIWESQISEVSEEVESQIHGTSKILKSQNEQSAGSKIQTYKNVEFSSEDRWC
jgi:hypothetical protein